jgi:hypothetical protein
MRSVRPTSLLSIVWNGVAVVAAPVCAYWPVMNGTFWPMTIFASSLSSVRRFGVERMFALASDSSARARKARFVTVPMPGMVTWPRTAPRLSPLPRLPMLTAPSMMLVPVPRAPKLVPPTACVALVLRS